MFCFRLKWRWHFSQNRRISHPCLCTFFKKQVLPRPYFLQISTGWHQPLDQNVIRRVSHWYPALSSELLQRKLILCVGFWSWQCFTWVKLLTLSIYARPLLISWVFFKPCLGSTFAWKIQAHLFCLKKSRHNILTWAQPSGSAWRLSLRLKEKNPKILCLKISLILKSFQSWIKGHFLQDFVLIEKFQLSVQSENRMFNFSSVSSEMEYFGEQSKIFFYRSCQQNREFCLDFYE